MGKKGVYLPLFWKFSFAIIIIVMFFGWLNYVKIKDHFVLIIENELKRRLNFITRTIAQQVEIFLSNNNSSSILETIESFKRNDTMIKFIIVETPNKEVILNFSDKELKEIIEENYSCQDSCSFEKDYPRVCRNFKLGVIQESIILKNGNRLYVGLRNDTINASINETMNIFIVLTLLFLVIGLIGAFIFSYLITKPINLLEKFTKTLDVRNLSGKNIEDFDKIISSPFFFEKAFVRDEINKLIETYREMLAGLASNQKEIQELQEQLIQLEKVSTIGVITAGLAHDINNPITGLLNSLSRLRKYLNENYQVVKYLDFIEETARKIQKVIKDLLSFSKKQEIEFAQVNLKKVIEKSILLVSYKINQSNIEIQTNFGSEDCVLMGSQHHLEQVFIYLLLNSIEALNEKYKTQNGFKKIIHIDITNNNDFIYIQIFDNGIGIPDDKINYIFQPFYTSKGNEGTGLGLSIVKHIINIHKGKIDILSEYGKWTKVVIIFKKKLEDEQV